MNLLRMTQLSRLKGRMRDVALGAGGGSSLGALLAWFARDYIFSTAAPEVCDSLVNTPFFAENSEYYIHWPSVGLGILIGFVLWPILEFLCLLKQYIVLWLRLNCQILLRGNRGDTLHRRI